MTMPDGDGVVATLLTNIGKDVAETRTDVAVIKEQLTRLPDFEQRIRENTADIVLLKAQVSLSRDMWARGVAGAAVLAAIGSAIAAYLHH